MEGAKKNGQMVPDMKDNTKMGKRKEEENSSGLMVLRMMESSTTIIFTVKDIIDGLTVEPSMVIGNSTRCMAMVFSLGLMAEGMKENISKIRNKVMVRFIGQMVGNTLDNGQMVNNMDVVLL